MSLCELISRAESDTLSEVDLDHPLLMDVLDEIAECGKEENSRLKQLFGDAKLLSDNILRPYFALSRTDRQVMAEVYQDEVFRKIRGIMGGKKKKYNKRLKGNLTLLSQISNFSKLIPILDNYIKTTNKMIFPSKLTLTHYLTNHNIKGEKVKTHSKETLINYRKWDFKTAKQNQNFTNEELIESMTFGLPEYKQKIKEAETAQPQREKIIEHYIKTTSKMILPSKLTLTYYLANHNIKGRKVEAQSKESLTSYRNWDFKTAKHNNNLTPEEVIESMTFGLPEYKQKVLDAESAINMRKQILDNYIETSSKTKYPSKLTLIHYLTHHNIKGKEAKVQSKETLSAFRYWDFRTAKINLKLAPEEVIESMTVDLPEYKQKIKEAESAIPQRKKIIEHYIKTTKTPEASQLTLACYLRCYTLDGEKVKPGNKEALISFRLWDFKTAKLSHKLPKSKVIESMTYGIPSELTSQVYEAHP